MRKNQRGFGGLAILLVILALVATVGAGYYVWQNQNKKDKTAAQSTAQTDQSTPTPPTAQTVADKNVIEIKELGIKITVPDSIKDLTYTYKTSKAADDREMLVAYFSTQKLTNLDDKCSSSVNAPLGAIGKVNGVYIAVGAYDDLVKQYPSYYLDYGRPQSQCSDNDTTQQLADKLRDELKNSLSTIEEL